MNQESGVDRAAGELGREPGQERQAWLALAMTPGLGPKRILDAVAAAGSASRVLELPLTELEGLRLPAAVAQFIFDGKSRQAAEAEWARVEAQGATILSYACAEYPERLREIYDPPPCSGCAGRRGC